MGPSRKELARILNELRAQLDRELVGELGSKIYLVCDELLNNSLEHGCFGIGALKKAELLATDSFEDFLVESERLANKCWIELELEINISQVLVKVRDSGSGYELAEFESEKSLDLARLSQRGLQLAQSLSSNLSVRKNPTQTTALFSNTPLR